MSWVWPLAGVEPLLPDSEGSFGARRLHDVHTGVDLYCEEGSVVVAVEDGEVVAVEIFTGPDAGSSWWLPTKAVLVRGLSGVVVYGEVEPLVVPGQTLKAGEPLGRVIPVLTKFKSRPMVMLHLELMASTEKSTKWWREERPEGLLDPTPLLPKEGVLVFDAESYDGRSFRPVRAPVMGMRKPDIE